MKRLSKIFLFVFIYFCGFIIVNAQDVPVELFKTQDVESYYNFISYGRTIFYKNGILTINNDSFGKSAFEYWSLDGELIKTAASIPATQSVIDMIYIDDYLYVLTSAAGSSEYYSSNGGLRSNHEKIDNLYLYKLDDEFRIKKEKYLDDLIIFSNYAENSDYGNNLLGEHDGMLYIEAFSDSEIEYCYVFYDYNLNNIHYFSNDSYFNKYIAKYCSKYENEYYLDCVYYYNELETSSKNFIRNNSELNLIYTFENPVYNNVVNDDIYIEIYNNYIIITKKENDSIINNFAKASSEYSHFSKCIIYGDLIAVVSEKNYDYNSSAYLSDLLFYDFDGNYVGKIEYDNSKIYYLNTDGEYLTVNTKKIDGMCRYDSYYNVYYINDGGCSSIANTYVYGYKEISNEIEEIDDVVEIVNPTTFSNKEFVILCLLLAISSVVYISYILKK